MEQALLKGELWAVAATNALELGVDIGSLDITLHLGFPGLAPSALHAQPQCTDFLVCSAGHDQTAPGASPLSTVSLPRSASHVHTPWGQALHAGMALHHVCCCRPSLTIQPIAGGVVWPTYCRVCGISDNTACCGGEHVTDMT